MERRKVYKTSKKPVVQLTSLLDLLFVMVFVSLLQQKNIPVPTPKKEPVKTASKPKPKPIEKPKPVVKKPEPVKLKNALVGATFNFSANSENPNSASGTYRMQGTFEGETRSLSLLGHKWLDRPNENYGMVPLEGRLSEDFKTFTGRIQFLGCKPFTLKKTLAIGTKPYSGKWEGNYDCAQGLTGLVLTID